MTLGWPQIIYLALTCLGLGISLAKDGEPRLGHYSFVGTLFVAIIVLSLLWWGGFFG